MAEPGFWDNQEQAQSLINDTNRMKEKSENFKQLEAKFDDAQTALELLKADPDPELSEELSEEMVSLSQSFHDYELSLLLSDKYDKHKDRKSTRLNSSHVSISYAVFCLKKKKL